VQLAQRVMVVSLVGVGIAIQRPNSAV